MGIRLRERICTVSAQEPPEAGYLLTQGLQLIGVSDDERGRTAAVLEHLDLFLIQKRERRAPVSKPSALSLALQLGVVLGQQFKRAGWGWIQFDWVYESPLARFEPAPDPEGHVSKPRWGLVPADRSLLVLPVHDLAAVLLLRRPPITFARAAPAALRSQGVAGEYELLRLVDDGVEFASG